mgnify:FL=1
MATQTVNFTFKAGDGTARARSASFVLTASPVIDGTTLVIGETVNASIAADGTGTVTLHPGDYKLTLTGEPNTTTISVPTSGTPHRLESLTGAGTTYVNSDIISGGADWPEQASVPAAPAAGKSKLYFKSDGLLYSQDEAGTETVFAAGSGYATVQEEGTGVTARTKLNFTGAGLTATDDAGNTRTQVALAALLNDIAGITAATGDILYYDGANIIKLAVGSNTEVLTLTAGVPAWAAATGGGDLSAADINTLAELNAIVADATLIDTGDSRLTDARTPTAHNQAASTINSGTLAHERGGLEADVSAYSGLVKITGGATSAVTDASANWNTAFGWGDHSGGGYLASTAIDTLAELNGIVADATLIDTGDSRLTDARTPTAHNQAASTINSGTLAHERGGLEADVSAYSGLVKITGGATSAVTDASANWNTAFGWGDHSGGGYLASTAIDTLAELNGIVGDATLIDTGDSRLTDARTPTAHNHAASEITSGTVAHERGGLEADVSAYSGFVKITGGATSAVTDASANWNTAYGWGDHSGQGYLASTAIDTLAELNAIVSDATLIDTGDSRLTDARTPTAHNQAASTINSGTLAAARLPAASTSAVGGMETATAAEVNTGTDAGRAVSPDSLAGSAYGTAVVTVLISDPNGDAITTGDGKAYWRVPSTLAGFNLVAVAAQVTTVSSSGLPTIQIHNLTDTADMLSTALTIDASELDSSTAATAAVINTSTDDVATGDQIRFDIDVAGTGTKGLMVEMQFRLP